MRKFLRCLWPFNWPKMIREAINERIERDARFVASTRAHAAMQVKEQYASSLGGAINDTHTEEWNGPYRNSPLPDIDSQRTVFDSSKKKKGCGGKCTCR